MNAISYIMLFFSLLGALDRIIGDRFGLGKEFEKGFVLLGNLALSMIGMIVIAPWLAHVLQPVFSFVNQGWGIEPSIIPAVLFANDMGGAPLATKVAADAQLGGLNALVVSAMMGCTVSFHIPYALGVVKKEQQKELLLGLLCGIVTIPVGCLAAGLFLKIPLGALLSNLLPLILFSLLIAAGLLLRPDLCVKIFGWIGTGIKILITIGLALAIFQFLTGLEPLPHLATLEEGTAICLNAAVIMTGAFPLLSILSRILSPLLKRMGQKLQINENSMLGFVSTLASSMPTYESMHRMDSKGVLMNAAFTVSAAASLADHLAFTLAYEPSYLPSMLLGKLTAGALALVVAAMLYRRLEKKQA